MRYTEEDIKKYVESLTLDELIDIAEKAGAEYEVVKAGDGGFICNSSDSIRIVINSGIIYSSKDNTEENTYEKLDNTLLAA